ncbi:MAG: metalloregulator ArsR/SmtB family transcription factor [Chloroflexaceae bacterium]|jgi:DNA-binding transcriptional ArsR family regulator|nr:metalloregulator ArsR/SmtB family transcription factor [Chloroflexaceae bacterium]
MTYTVSEPQATTFTDVFHAIAHPARRKILDLLRAGDRPVKQLAAPFSISRPAISQHLRILLDAGLVTENRVGRERRYHLQAERLKDVQNWLDDYRR